uniref:GPI inositol-deacylase,MCherry protein n=1 Tax=Psychromonas sp. B3M02 TaxID=2267226 RepID=UPI002AC9F217|nr:Chain A, GPI inositol-deacylase,MCherry protein [synthetic construct]
MGSRSLSSASSDDDDAPPIRVPRVNQCATSRTKDSQSPAQSASKLDRRRSADRRPSFSANRRSGTGAGTGTGTGIANWRPFDSRDATVERAGSSTATTATTPPPSSSLGLMLAANGAVQEKEMVMMGKAQEHGFVGRRAPWRSPWAISVFAFVTSLLGIGLLLAVIHSSVTRQIDPKGCRMSYMRPSYAKLSDFDTEHTRLASKYSLYLYREQGIDHDVKVRGVPVLFIPGNAGSYKQVRPIAAEAANYFHDVLQHDEAALRAGVRSLDFFTVDFNEDITAFHGQTLLDQAEYLNEAIRYILSLYLDPRVSERDPDLPDPTSVIVLGHAMGGIVARTMLIMPNYQHNSINTIITMSAPHARPPVSFDGQIVQTYKDINNYWRHAYSQKWANDNPLWHVTLVSIAGGGLDTVVPSDYASIESLVPDTHGFTVFTSTIPNVWTSMDHQAILWCDQFRKVIIRALFDIVDVHRASQTKPRAQRMRVFKKWFLSGMETVAEKIAPTSDPTTLLIVDDKSDSITAEGERLVLRELGTQGSVRAHLMPIPPPGSPELKRFTLLTDTKLDKPGENGKLEVMFCSVIPSQPNPTGPAIPSQLDLSKGNAGTTRLACTNVAPDVITLPASTRFARFPFSVRKEAEIPPFSYLEYVLDDISEHQFVAVIEKATIPTPGFVIAEFSDHSNSHHTRHIGLRNLLTFGISLRLPSNRPMMSEVRIPSVKSSLLAYNLRISALECSGRKDLFAPLVRQYLAEPYESKYFVNARQAAVSLHGVAPYVPPPMSREPEAEGLAFQLWTDPTCNSSIQVDLTVDVMGSLGKLYMRYRTVFAAFPLFIVSLVLRKQFQVYDSTGSFITFAEGLDLSLRQSIPVMLIVLAALTLSTTKMAPSSSAGLWHWGGNTTFTNFHQNDLLIGTQDPFFLFLIPLIGIICVGVCTVVNYIALSLTRLISVVISFIGFLTVRFGWVNAEDRRRPSNPAIFPPSSPRRRMITTAVLLFLVSTMIPYQLAYLVACLVQLGTLVRAQRISSELRSPANSNFHNYVHSIFILMLWILPINLPTLVVWMHNLSVHWLTPFTSHHNVFSIMPFILLVETHTTGQMIPRTGGTGNGRCCVLLRHITSILLLSLALYAAVYGVSYAYTLHQFVNLFAFWLVMVHSTADDWSLTGLRQLILHNRNNANNKSETGSRKRGKEPGTLEVLFQGPKLEFVSKGEEDNMAIIKEFMRFKVHMEGSVNGHEFEIEGEGEGRPYEGTQTAKLKVTKGGPLPFAWDILSPQFMYGSKAYVKHPADIPDYLKLSFPEGFKWERVMNFEDGGVVTVTQDSSLQDGEFIYKVKLRGTNFPSDGPVMQKKTMGSEASSERMYPEDGALKGEVKYRLKLKDGGHYDAEVKTTYKAKKPVQLPGAYNVNRKLDITSHNEDYTIVEQYERAEGRHSTGGMDELYKSAHHHHHHHHHH